jgi:pimeloyl-ACP methyl ester carboxylesterase
MRNDDSTVPRTQYARSGRLNIAYQVVGNGPWTLVVVPGWVSHVELAWQMQTLARFLERLASFARLIVSTSAEPASRIAFPMPSFPASTERIDDLCAAMDATGTDSASLFGYSKGGKLAMTFAAAHPARVSALVTFGVFAKRIWSPDYPRAPTPEARDRVRADRARVGAVDGSVADHAVDARRRGPSSTSRHAMRSSTRSRSS